MDFITLPALLFAAAASLQPAAQPTVQLVPQVENTYHLVGNDDNTTTRYEYNNRGQVVSSLTSILVDGQVGDPIEKNEYQYDERQPSLRTYNMVYRYENNQWNVADGCERTSLTYNSADQVTGALVEQYSTEAGDFVPYERVTLTYSAANQPKTLTVEEYNTDEQTWSTSQKVTDMVWESYSGTLPDFTDMANVFGNGNKLKSAKVSMAIDYDMTLSGTLSITYPDDKGSYVFNLNAAAAMNMVTAKVKMTHTVTDEFGSYEDRTDQTMSIMGMGTDSQYERSVVEFDRCGLKLMEYSEEGGADDTEVYSQGLTRRVPTYSADQNYVISYEEYQVTDTDESMENLLLTKRVELLDYIDPAGVENVAVDTDTPAKYYDLRGIPVTNPTTPGIYLKRQTGKVTKVAL